MNLSTLFRSLIELAGELLQQFRMTSRDRSLDKIRPRPLATRTPSDIVGSNDTTRKTIEQDKNTAKQESSPPEADAALIEINCPECGAPISVSEDNYTTKCRFCTSLLIIEKIGDTLYFQIPSRINNDEDIIKVLEDFYANRYYNELIGSIKSLLSDDRDLRGSDLFVDSLITEATKLGIEKKVRSMRQQFRSSVKLIERNFFYAPYWHMDGIVGNGYLGRNKRSGAKKLEPRFYLLEFTSPAYDEKNINLRDAGLRIAGKRVVTLHKRKTIKNFPYLEPGHSKADLFKQARFWFRRIPWGEMQPIQSKTVFLHKRARLVFKPFWTVKYEWKGYVYHQLLDGDYKSVAGNLVYEKDSEIITHVQKDKPLYPEGSLEAKMIPSECPICNYEQYYDSYECIHFCHNCYRALELSHGEIRDLSYYTVLEGLKGQGNNKLVFIPFWAFEIYINLPDSREILTLKTYMEETGAKLKGKPVFDAQENMIFVPAMKIFGGVRPDKFYCLLTKEMTCTKKTIILDKLNLDIKAKFIGATLTANEATELIPFLLYALFDKPTAMRFNKLTVQDFLQNIQLHIDKTVLILVPFQENNIFYINPLLTFKAPKSFINGSWVKEWIRTAYFRKQEKKHEDK